MNQVGELLFLDQVPMRNAPGLEDLFQLLHAQGQGVDGVVGGHTPALVPVYHLMKAKFYPFCGYDIRLDKTEIK